jgi:hypothetical protein
LVVLSAGAAFGAAGTRLEAEPARTVDEQMPASDFDALLTMVGPVCGLHIRHAAPGEPIRCLLLPNAAKFFSTARFGLTQQPSLAIDVGDDALWVIDRYRNTLMASAWVGQVTAVPAMYTSQYRGDITMPALVLYVPGLQPLMIGYPDPQRFSWPGAVGEVEKPAYLVSGADWLTLVERFGLTRYLETHDTTN